MNQIYKKLSKTAVFLSFV